jgi:hypothetical protein
MDTTAADVAAVNAASNMNMTVGRANPASPRILGLPSWL